MRSHNAPNDGRIGACPQHIQTSEERNKYRLHIGALGKTFKKELEWILAYRFEERLHIPCCMTVAVKTTVACGQFVEKLHV